MHGLVSLRFSVLLLSTTVLFFETHADDAIECGLYLAESTIPGAGLGIFAGHDYKVGEDIGRGDVCIPFIDMYW
jgi:hypothetical protein